MTTGGLFLFLCCVKYFAKLCERFRGEDVHIFPTSPEKSKVFELVILLHLLESKAMLVLS